MGDLDKRKSDQQLFKAANANKVEGSQPKRTVTITGVVHAGTQSGSSRTAGVHIEHLDAEVVHFHDAITVSTAIIAGLLSFLSAVATSVATSVLPGSWKPYLWLAWPIAAAVTVASILVAVQTSRRGATSVQHVIVRPADRAALLGNVRRIWIDGVLNQALRNNGLIALPLRDQPDAVEQPYGLHLRASSDDSPLPPGTTIQHVYDAQQGALLIIGEPGSGKTTLLLELAQMLIDRADQNPEHPIPVVFKLASWTEKQLLVDWLVTQLNREYNVPKKIGRAIVITGALLPLLDGLDEVVEGQRAACVEAINRYRREHEVAWATPIVVCCRDQEYKALPVLKLHGAILIEPLKKEEIDDYLRARKQGLAGVRAVLKEDPKLYELLATPLLLTVTMAAFVGQSANELRQATSTDKRRRTILAAFVERQLQLPPKGKSVVSRYGQTCTLHWLTWIAQRLRESNETVFWIENLQPDWLSPTLRRIYPVLVVSILVLMVIIFLRSSDNNVWLYWVLGVVLASLLKGKRVSGISREAAYGSYHPVVLGTEAPLPVEPFTTYPGDPGKRDAEYVEYWTWNVRWFWGMSVGGCVFLMALHLQGWNMTHPILLILGIIGLIASFCTAILAPIIDRLASGIMCVMQGNPERALNMTLIVGFGVFVGLGLPFAVAIPSDLPKALIASINIGVSFSLFIKPLSTIHMIEQLEWRWRSGVFVGILSGALIGLSLWSFTDGLRIMIVFGLLAGISGREMIDTRLKPNQGIRRSAMNALTGLAVGIVIWLVVSVATVIGLPPSVMTYNTAVQAGVIAALIWGLRGGLIVCVQHVVLRLLLLIMGAMPLFVVRMLDDASSRILLHKTGGGYIFHHLLLQDYFADREVQQRQ